MKFLAKLLDYFEESLIIIMLAYMAIMNFLNVVFRYCFANSFSFTEELTITVFVWVTMLGASAAFKRNAHMGMSFVADLFHGKARAFASLFVTICNLLFMIILLYYGIEMVQGQMTMGSTTPVLRMPQYVQGLSMPCGAVLIIIRVIQSGIELFKEYWNSTEGGAEA